MNNKEAIRRKKLYYESLEKVVAQPIPEAYAKEIEDILDDPETLEDHRLILKLWKEVSAPLSIAVAFIHDNRVLPQYKEQLIHDEAEMPFMQPDEIYDTLMTLIPPTIGEFLSVLQISSSERGELLYCIERGDKDGFVSQLEKVGCDTTPLARLCSHCTDDVMAGLSMTDEERAFCLDHIVGTVYVDVENEKCREAIAELQSYVEATDSEDTPESIDQFYSDFFGFLESQLTADLHYYWNYYDMFTLKERNLIESILDKPIAVNLVNRIWDDYRSNLVFNLPDDFFNSKCDADDTEHLYLKPSVESKGTEVFASFINYVAEKGYIENSPSVKKQFAFRLSGYYRPEEEFPTIVWNGKNSKSYELIYIIRYLCDRADYKKMRRFFEGCEWVKEKDSSYAVSADSEFKRKMSELYPDTCPFK